MKRLTPKDGKAIYDHNLTITIRTTARYPQTCAVGERLIPLREKLRQATENESLALRAQTEATADRVLNDYEDDDLVRELNADAKQAERRDPTLGLQKALFPAGLEAVISGSGESQQKRMKALVDRLDAVKSRAPELAQTYKPKILAAMEKTTIALRKQAEAFEKTRQARLHVELVKSEVREAFEVTYGELRTLFKANPKKAERFFASTRTKAATPADAPSPSDSDE